MEATYNGHLECVKLLASRGASWKKRDQSGIYRYHQSSCMLSMAFLALGMSALHWAVDGGHEGVVYYALNEEGVKVESTYCPTPLVLGNTYAG